MPRARGMTAYVRDGYGVFHQPKCLVMPRNSVVVAKCCFLRLLCETEPLSVQYLPDRIFDCLLASIGSAEDVRDSFLLVGDLNSHHQQRLGSTTTNRHGVAALDFATDSGCDQLVVGPTDDATSECIPIAYGMPMKSLLGTTSKTSEMFEMYTSEMFELVENRLYCMPMLMTPYY